ncbi:MAG: hypothetical protein Q9N67_10495 [Ghiorsea sp.]|nr:hypothetical protein [Ghiorsea sp.]
MIYRFLTAMCLLLVLSSCAGKSGNDLRVSLGFKSAFETAQTEFHQGLIMESRSRILSIDSSDEDYKQAQTFLKKEIEPARLKLLRYYARKGKSQERKREWAKAEEAYRMAVELSQQPKALLKYKKNMNLKVRQLRFDTLYAQLKKEDTAWLKWKKAYIPPKGLLMGDEAFRLASEDMNQKMKLHEKKRWALAGIYEQKDRPELAWLYADSYLRLMPNHKKAQDLKNAMTTAVPKGFKLLKRKVKKSKKKLRSAKVSKKVVNIPVVYVVDVESLMKKGEWLEAREKALQLRQQGHAQADKLLVDIDTNILVVAEKYYQNGNLAFRTEKIGDAVKFWQQAVDFNPNEQTYVDSLRRGQQIQERLNALKTEDKK